MQLQVTQNVNLLFMLKYLMFYNLVYHHFMQTLMLNAVVKYKARYCYFVFIKIHTRNDIRILIITIHIFCALLRDKYMLKEGK